MTKELLPRIFLGCVALGDVSPPSNLFVWVGRRWRKKMATPIPFFLTPFGIVPSLTGFASSSFHVSLSSDDSPSLF